MKFDAHIDLVDERNDSIGIIRSPSGFTIIIKKSDVNLSIDLSKEQMLKLKGFLDSQVNYFIKESSNETDHY